MARRLKIEISVPETHVENVLDALHDAGGGRVGEYVRCASVWKSMGTWQPLPGAQPYHGEVGEVAYGAECRIESVCDEQDVAAIREAIRDVHPYEEAVIHFLPLYEP